MPLVCTILITLAALGVVFLVVLLACTLDGFETWHNWRKFTKLAKEIGVLADFIASARKKGEETEEQMRQRVARIHESPFPPCNHHDCPRRSGNR